MTNPGVAANIDSSLLKYYSRLRDHRCGITEGIRVIAFRNMDHLTTVSQQLGITGRIDEDSYSRVQDRMLEDQGLEKTDASLWWLGYATLIPWEIYMCLLYAEIENYKLVLRKHSSLVYQPLEDYLASHQAVVQSLEDARDALLHPLKADYGEAVRRFMDGANLTAPDYRIALVEVQSIVDDYLECLRDSLIESVLEEAEALSLEQLYEQCRNQVAGLTSLLAQASSIDERVTIEKMLQEDIAYQDRFRLYVDPDVDLTPGQQQQLARWQQNMDDLTWPLPKRPYELNPASIQTPIHPELFFFLPRLPTENQESLTGHLLPRFVRERRSGCLPLLLRSLTLFNESYSADVEAITAMFPNTPRNEIIGDDDLRREFVQRAFPLETVGDYQRAVLRTSPFIVAQALLAEPLRLYKQITSDRPELKREEIEQRVIGEVLATLLRLRNVVFHVPDDRTDMLKAEKDFHRKASAMGDYREIFGGLWRFYMPDLAALTKSEDTKGSTVK